MCAGHGDREFLSYKEMIEALLNEHAWNGNGIKTFLDLLLGHTAG